MPSEAKRGPVPKAWTCARFPRPDAPGHASNGLRPFIGYKSSGTASARFDSRRFWSGAFADPDSHARFATFQARWEANGRQVPDEFEEVARFAVADLVALHLDHSEVYYGRANGGQIQEVADLRYSGRPRLES